MTKGRWYATALLVSAFVVGGLAGGVVVAIGEARSHEHRGGGDRRGGGGNGGGHLGRLTSELQLTEEQRDSVVAILARYQPVTDSMWREIRPAFDAVRDQIRNDIRAQLGADQQQAYAAMIERQEREYRERAARRDRRDRGSR